MPADPFKPLFNRRLLDDARRGFAPCLDDEQQRIATSWATSAGDGSLLSQKEKPLQGQFLSQVFDRLLGYRQIVSGDGVHHMEPETSSKAVKGYRPPDARLGWYGAGLERTRGVLELKAPGADLDAKQAASYGRLTPVEQAFGYAAKVDGCRWVLVSNFIELRLYRTDRGQGYCQRFALADLADPEVLRTFLFLLSRERLFGIAPESESPVERLASSTHVEEQRISKAFYVFYRDLRIDLFHQLRADNPAPAGTPADAHLDRLLELAQKILDRCLFICFCEDTRLLPPKILTQALTTKTAGFVQVSRWQQLCGLFQAVDRGHPPMQINGYNGGLFASDPDLDGLQVADASLDGIEALAGYDFETDLNVNILGHIFEQSISDLEALRAEIRGEAAAVQRSRRKRDGIFYTPELITSFMVARTIGGWLAEREAEIEARHRTGKPGPMAKETRLKVMVDYLEVLKHIKVLDPACGSGAFLVAAFDYLIAEYERVNAAIAELTGAPQQLGLFDLDRQILQDNLFGVDLNRESVEITKLSLWLKTARRDKPLNNLDDNVRCGNSLVEPPGPKATDALREAFAALPSDSRAFDWRAAFPAVFERGGFDVVLGNPPYVRQEALGTLKAYLAQCYAAYSGVADLYVYFYERGLDLLAPGGKLSYIVTNKWLRAGYGEPLRRLFSERAVFEEIVDFGHAPIFEDADTFPCIIVARRRPAESESVADPQPPTVSVCPVPRDRSAELSLDNYVHEHAYPVPWSRYGAEPWSLEPPEVDTLMQRIRERGTPLAELLGVKPMYGIKTGLNEAFLIDDGTRTALIRDDPGCADIIKPYLRGQDIKRWAPDWQGLWMIFARRGIDIEAYPSVLRHLERFRERLEPKPSDWDKATQGDWPGRKPGSYAWYEIQDSVDYWRYFDGPKIIHTDIMWRAQFAFSDSALYPVNTCYIWPTSDIYVLAVLNSPLIWAFMWRNAQHGKDEALRMFNSFTMTLPIAEPTPALRTEIEEHAAEALELTGAAQTASRELLDWLRIELGIDKPGQRLAEYQDLSADDFTAEVRKRRPKGAVRLSPKTLAELAATHGEYADPERRRAARLRTLEQRLAELVNQAYGLSADDIDLLWRTAPPRMPGV
jgi:hypothetical protein